MAVDAIQLEVIANRLEEIQQVMKHRLFHTGYSTILRESFDGSAGLTTADGRLIGASGVVTHTVPYSRMVRAVIEQFGPDAIHPGDTFITNDPYKGGVPHTPDIGTATPVFSDGKLVSFCTSLGHKTDIGGIVPSTASAASRSIFHEGLLLPPVKYLSAGKVCEGVRSIISNNSRTPHVLLGDIEGQVGSTRIGCQLFQDLCKQYGAPVVTEVMELLIQSSASRLRLALAALPDGENEVENFLDNDGTNEEPIRIHISLSKRGDQVRLDLSRCSAQVAGPVNAPVQVIKAVAAGAIVGLVDHTIPYNDGILQVVDVVCPDGLVVNPCFPAPVNAYIPITHLVFNCVTTALGRLVPSHAVAESGLGLGGIAFGYQSTRHGDRHVQYEIPETALGGTCRSDGASMIFPMMIFETIQPIEILESEFPVRVTNFGINCDSAGAGRHRGGIGYVREYKVLDDCLFMSRCAQRRFDAKGVAGGLGPKRPSFALNPGRPDEYQIRGLDELKLSAGDVVRIEMSGGGGWGDPHARPDHDVLGDVADGYVSIEGARTDYGRVIRRGLQGEFIVDDVAQAR